MRGVASHQTAPGSVRSGGKRAAVSGARARVRGTEHELTHILSNPTNEPIHGI